MLVGRRADGLARLGVGIFRPLLFALAFAPAIALAAPWAPLPKKVFVEEEGRDLSPVAIVRANRKVDGFSPAKPVIDRLTADATIASPSWLVSSGGQGAGPSAGPASEP